MRNTTKILAGCLLAAAGAWIAGCNSAIDSGNGPAVVLETENLTIPPITAAADQNSGGCTYTVTNATVTLKNKPKNSGADKSPFNDILMQGVDINYTWDDGNGVAAYSAGLGGSVAANGSSTAQFAPVGLADLVAGNRAGHSAALSLKFRGTTVSGDNVTTTTGGSLLVNSCATVPVGACCLISGACNVSSQATCVANAGTYQGDNTSCLTTPCN
ncbi:MAG TPA: hypothetical protein VFV19_12855 [Candidatus Polarisedimenticolaceae bacterium]|nr:hypothetical protein [Candidatus Polarisedimenticolaceae bacterium]